MSTVLFEGKSITIPLPDVQHFERGEYGLVVVTKHTHWDFDRDGWANNAFVPRDEADAFLAAWREYLTGREQLPQKSAQKTTRDWRTWKRIND